MRKTHLVTGATGFIGTRLCAALGEDSRVRALSRRNADGPWSESVAADLTEGVPRDATLGVDTVFHLAGYTHAVDGPGDDERPYRRVNVEGTRALLERSREAGVRRFVFVSSVKVLGEGGDSIIDDDSPARPRSAYGRTKLEAERLVLEGGYVPEQVVLRPTLVYGPGVKGNLLSMIAAVDAGRFPPARRLTNRRSMVHVDDLVRAALGAARKEAVVGRCFIVSDGVQYSTRRIYEIVCEALEKPPRPGVPLPVFRVLAWVGDLAGAVTRRRAPFDSQAYAKLFGSACYDGSALWQALGAEPIWTLEAAMTDMVAAFRGR
jgi:nucleoside-diphosphate-sugar epimerase